MDKIEQALIQWKNGNPRNLPWKSTKDPYKIWVSEIILQQTRVEQGTPYYLKFIKVFPSIEALASATIDEVLSCWKGLGYYSRARNLHESAKYLVKENGGKFPVIYKEILALKGIGPYTAAAIASFAYGQKYPVLDGNVIRLVSRLFMIGGKRNSAEFIDQCYFVLNKLMQHTADAALFNQAIMDFGSKVCRPQNPLCPECALNRFCQAYTQNQVKRYPPSKKKIVKQKRCFHYFVAIFQNELILSKREDKDIWQELYTFPEIETQGDKALSLKEVKNWSSELFGLKSVEVLRVVGPLKQTLSHQAVKAFFYEVMTNKMKSHKYTTIKLSEIEKVATPRIISTYLEKYYKNINE